MKKSEPKNTLHALAKACGVQLSYRDLDGRIKRASSRALLAAIRSLGIDVKTSEDCVGALEKVLKEGDGCIIEPVQIAWGGRLSGITVKLSTKLPKILKAKLELESLEIRRFQWTDPARFSIQTAVINGTAARVLHLPVKGRLPFGYHRLTFVIGKSKVSTLIVSAPRRIPESPVRTRRWGLFCPLYALHSNASWGAGDLSDFFKMAQWSASVGGSVIATLPLLPVFYREHFNPSPYSPVSRLFWNELFINLESVPELTRCPEAAMLLASNKYTSEIQKLQSERLVDYPKQMDLKRRILELLAECFFLTPESEPRRQAFEEYLRKKRDLKNYARFRAVSERLKSPWTEWPKNLRDGFIDASDYDPKIEGYFLYTQFVYHEQMADVASKAKAIGQSLYLDLPLGANPDGYDVWKNQEIFARGSNVGAPPDPAFPGGQDWGFPPLHPDLLRESGYRYFIDVIRHHLQFASVLRLDHIMGLHRLYWIPDGLSPDDGVYVRYEAEEMYAILCLEASRANAMIVGEDLGLVPDTVRWAMRRHNIYRSYVAQYEMLVGNDDCLDAIPVHAVATANTHDMHPFAAFWMGTDIEERTACGVLSTERANLEISRRSAGKHALLRCLRQRNLLASQSPSPMEVYRAIGQVMAGSDVEIMLLSIDDLCGSTEAQNIPGTCIEHPNWRLKASKSLEKLRADQEIETLLGDVDRERRRAPKLK